MTQDSPAPDHRDTEPIAIWGFVLTFVFWPAGLVLSWLALRRVRRSGRGGWGLAVAGAALSTIAAASTLIGGAILLARSDLPATWAAAARERADARSVSSAVDAQVDALVAEHDSTGAWPAMGAQDVDGVTVRGFRTGDEVCVEGELGSHVAARVVGQSLEVDGRCGDHGFDRTLGQAAAEDARAAVEAREADLMAAAAARADAVASGAALGPEPDMGLLGHHPVDLDACSAVRSAWAVIDDAEAREGLALYLAAGYREHGGSVWYLDPYLSAEPSPGPDQDAVAVGLLYTEWTCWLGGFTSEVWSPPLPPTWTTPLTQQELDRSEQLREAYLAGDAAAGEQLSMEHQAEQDAIMAAIRQAWDRSSPAG